MPVGKQRVVLILCILTAVLTIFFYRLSLHTYLHDTYVTTFSKQDNFRIYRTTNIPTTHVATKALHESRNTTISDILFTVKSGKNLHRTRLKLLLDTWISLVPSQTYVITDDHDEEFQKYLHPGHLIETHCARSHAREDLCCKMGHEIGTMVRNSARYRWFCRADDDTYYNPSGLLMLLNKLDWREAWLVGNLHNHAGALGDGKPFWYPVGNAGVCMSQSVITRISAVVEGDKFSKFCKNRVLNDDVALSVIAVTYGRATPAKGRTMYSHGAQRVLVLSSPLNTIATINYRERKLKVERPSIEPPPPVFNVSVDPTRLKSLHCHLHPELSLCQPLKIHATNT